MLEKQVQYIKGVGPAKVKLLNKLGINTLEDLITYFPREHEDRSKPKQICDLQNGEEALIKVSIVSKMVSTRIGSKTMQKLIVRDNTDVCTITWFNQPYLKDKFVMGQTYYFFGKVSLKYGKIDMVSPVYDTEGSQKNTCKIIPIYPSTYGLSQNSIRQIIENGLRAAGKREETLPQNLLEKCNIVDLNTATKQIHFPDSFEAFNKARRRLAFEELFSTQIALLTLKNNYTNEQEGIQFSKEVKMSDVIQALPFKLTKAQLRVLEEIDRDMESVKPMNRLLQGDVGSRKNNCKYCSCI